MITQFILFGATGDLASHKLFPALFAMQRDDLLAPEVQIIAIGRRDYSQEEFLGVAYRDLATSLASEQLDEQLWQRFAARLHYYRMDFRNPESYALLASYLAEPDLETISGRLFYLSVPPADYQEISSQLARHNLHQLENGGWVRLVLEKPFGRDLVTAQTLNTQLSHCFQEEQLYRIDHYLAKETVQNIMAFRFANGIFESLWNHRHIDHIQITVAEEGGIGSRGAFYDQTGAFRDLVQNHLLQILAVLTMDQPAAFTPEALAKEKLAVLEHLQVDLNRTVFGQYDGYQEEDKVAAGSQTETYAMTTFYIDSDRWAGVPIYVRTGKRLSKRISEVSIQFKEGDRALFSSHSPGQMANILTFRLQPDEGIALQLSVKAPRENTAVQPVRMEFCYNLAFRQRIPDAYERLLGDIIKGDHLLALSKEEIEASWRAIDYIYENRQRFQLAHYSSDGWGPEEAEAIIVADGRQWLAHESEICNGVLLV